MPDPWDRDWFAEERAALFEDPIEEYCDGTKPADTLEDLERRCGDIPCSKS